jgi:hypothetical protein
MNNNNRICDICGGNMKQTGGARGMVRYHCPACGNDDYIEIDSNKNYEYWQRRNDLLGRVKTYTFENGSAYQWDYLLKEIDDFTNHYPEANQDIYFKMAFIACCTNGFTNLNSEKLKKCHSVFKAIDKVYKNYTKGNTANINISKTTGDDGFSDYETYRKMYNKCWFDYQKDKLAWKILFKCCKFLIPKF